MSDHVPLQVGRRRSTGLFHLRVEGETLMTLTGEQARRVAEDIYELLTDDERAAVRAGGVQEESDEEVSRVRHVEVPQQRAVSQSELQSIADELRRPLYDGNPFIGHKQLMLANRIEQAAAVRAGGVSDIEK